MPDNINSMPYTQYKTNIVHFADKINIYTYSERRKKNVVISAV